MSLDDKNLPTPESPESDNPFSAFEEVHKPEEKTSHKGRGNTLAASAWAGVWIAAIAAVLLGGLVLWLTLSPPSTTDGNGDTTTTVPPMEDVGITLVDKTNKNAVPISLVNVENSGGSHTLIFNTTEKKLQIKGYEDIMVDQELENTLIAYTTIITARNKIEKPAALSAYGLDKPQAKATIAYTDGTSSTVTVGNNTPSNEGYYGQISGDNNVYIFNSDNVRLFMMQPVAYANTILLTTPEVKADDANGSALLKEISYSGKNHPVPLHIRRSYYTDSEEMTLFSYIIDKPYIRGTSDAVIGQLTSFKSLQAAQALYLHPTAEQKKKLGFDDPLVVMDLTMAVETSEDDAPVDTSAGAEKKSYYNSYSTTITVGSLDSSSNYVVMVKGIDAIFLVENSALSAIADRTYTNSVNQLLFLKNIGQLGRIAITIDGVRHDFSLTHYPEKENRDEKMVVTCDGKTYPTADFRELYQQLMGLERYGTPSGEYTKNATLKVDIYTTDGTHYLGATYYPLSGTLCAVETTEGEIFTTRWHYVTHFVEQVKNYLNGQPVLILT